MGVAAVTMITGVAVVADAINGGLTPPPAPLPSSYLIGNDLPLNSLPFKGRVGVGMGQLRRKNTPIPLLASPLKGEEPEQRKIGRF